MFKPKRVAAKLVAVLGGAGLAFSLCVPGAKAVGPLPPPFGNSNYNNRYVCNENTSNSTFTGANTTPAEIILHTNGSGSFTSGIMQAPISANSGTYTAGAPFSGTTGNFCEFDLDASSSSYIVDTNGIGVEVLTWTPNSGNNPNCVTLSGYPGSPFVTSDSFVMRLNGIRPSGAIVRTEVTSNNLLGQGNAGAGYCLK